MPPPDDDFDFLVTQAEINADAQRAQAEFLRLQAAAPQEPAPLTEAALNETLVEIQRAVQEQRIAVTTTQGPAPRTPTEQEQHEMLQRWYQRTAQQTLQRPTAPWTTAFLQGATRTEHPIITATQARGNKDMSKTAIPRWARESFCETQGRQDILVRFSDIKRLLKAIHTDSKTMQVFVKTKAPALPPIDYAQPAYNLRIKYDNTYNPVEGINEVTKVYYEPGIIWQKFDSWANIWVDINEDQILSDPKKRWLTWLTKWKNWKNGTGVVSHEAPVWDYFTFVINRVFNKRAIDYSNLDRKYQDRKFWTQYCAAMNVPDGTAILAETYHRQRTGIPNAGSVTARNMHRGYRLKVPSMFRFPYKMNQEGYLEIFKTLYKTKYGTDWNKTIFHGRHSGQIELEDVPLDQLPLLGLARIPRRFVEVGLVRVCDCCDSLTQYDNSFHLDPALPEHKISIEYLNKLKNKDKVPTEKIEPKENVKDVHPLFNLKTSNPLTEFSRQVYISSFLGSDKKPASNNGTLVAPLWGYAPTGYLTPAALKKHFILCHSCQAKNFGQKARTRQHGENELPMWGRDYIRNYTDNPIKYHPTMGAPTKASFNVGPNERRILRETIEQIPIDTVKEPYMGADGTMRTRLKTIFKDVRNLKDKTLYMGVELEVTPSEALRKKISAAIGAVYTKGTGNSLQNYDVGYTASLVEKFLNMYKVGIMKADASVHGGFEIVTVPGTLAWHKGVAWNTFFKENYENPEEAKIAPSAFLAGWSNNGGLTPCSNYEMPTCGIHIHVSKDALTPLQLGKIINFVGDNKAFITKIAGRDENRYAPFKKKKISDGSVLKYIGQGNAPRTGPIRGELFDGTREAVNVNTSGKPTIEFRMFRSNVSKAGFFKNLEFVHALVSWCGTESSANNLDHKEFIKWVSENKEPYEFFYKWLVKNKFLNSKHKANPEFIERKVLDLETKLVTLKKFPNPGYKAELEDAA